MRTVLVSLDWSLILFHTVLVLFNCTGWIWRKTRRLHLATIGATLGSWIVLGVWFGPGYCLCTDLQWRVRTALGERLTEDTYIQFLVKQLTGWTPNAQTTSTSTAIVTGSVLALSLWLNYRDYRTAKRSAADPLATA